MHTHDYDGASWLLIGGVVLALLVVVWLALP